MEKEINKGNYKNQRVKRISYPYIQERFIIGAKEKEEKEAREDVDKKINELLEMGGKTSYTENREMAIKLLSEIKEYQREILESQEKLISCSIRISDMIIEKLFGKCDKNENNDLGDYVADNGGNDNIILEVVNSLSKNLDDKNITANLEKLKEKYGSKYLSVCIIVINMLQTIGKSENYAEKILKKIQC